MIKKNIQKNMEKEKKESFLDLIMYYIAEFKSSLRVIQPLNTGIKAIDKLYGRYVEIRDPIKASLSLNSILYYLNVLIEKARRLNIMDDYKEFEYWKAKGAIKQLLERLDFFHNIVHVSGNETELIKLLGYIESLVVSLASLEELINEIEKEGKVDKLLADFDKLLDIEKKEFLSKILKPEYIKALPERQIIEIRDLTLSLTGLDTDAIIAVIPKLSPKDRYDILMELLKVITPLEAKQILDQVEAVATSLDIMPTTRRRRKSADSEEEDEDE